MKPIIILFFVVMAFDGLFVFYSDRTLSLQGNKVSTITGTNLYSSLCSLTRFTRSR